MNYIIIGNGESRQPINISKLNGVKIGCNAIYLHENVNMLSAFDKFWRDKITQETTIPLLSRINNNAAQTHIQMYVRGKWIDTDTLYRGYCSGIAALDYTAQHATIEDKIYMIGFDFSYNGTTVDHIYKNTPNHPRANRPAQNANVFLNECLQTVKRHPLKQIIYVNDVPCDSMKRQLTITDFLKDIN